MEEAHCHQHPIPPLLSSPSPVPSSARPPPRSTHAPSPCRPPAPPPATHTPAHPTLHPPPAVDTRAPVFQVEPRPLVLPPRPEPPSGCRRTSRRVTSVVMHVNTSPSLAACPRVLLLLLLTFATSPPVVSPPTPPPREVILRRCFSCSLGGRALATPSPSPPLAPPLRYLLAEFWLERQRKVGC